MCLVIYLWIELVTCTGNPPAVLAQLIWSFEDFNDIHLQPSLMNVAQRVV